MSNWDLFYVNRLEVDRDLSTAKLQSMLQRGTVTVDDLVRPAGSSETWRRVGDTVALRDILPSPAPPKAVEPSIPTAVLLDDLDDVPPAGIPETAAPSPPREDRQVEREQLGASAGSPARGGAGPSPSKPRTAPAARDVAPPVEPEEPVEPEYDPLAEDAEAAEFTFASRGGHGKEEDLDLAAMVDVAFQLILFFLVTASTVYFKSVEIPAPDPEKSKQSQQAVARTIQDLQNENILVEIDARGGMLLDHEPIPPETLAAKMRSIRENKGITTMLLIADRATPHKYVVQALDAANEISIAIKIGRTTESE